MIGRPQFTLRHAIDADAAAITRLIARSARGLAVGDYTHAQVEAALRGAFGLDTQLLADRSFLVAECAGDLAGCGGWSRRRTLFGGDAGPARDAACLDPARDAARIRAFFVDPAYARRGIGRALLERCEAEAAAAGFRAFELLATLPGVRLYTALGYRPLEEVEQVLDGGSTIRFVRMRREVGPEPNAN